MKITLIRNKKNDTLSLEMKPQTKKEERTLSEFVMNREISWGGSLLSKLDTDEIARAYLTSEITVS